MAVDGAIGIKFGPKLVKLRSPSNQPSIPRKPIPTATEQDAVTSLISVFVPSFMVCLPLGPSSGRLSVKDGKLIDTSND